MCLSCCGLPVAGNGFRCSVDVFASLLLCLEPFLCLTTVMFCACWYWMRHVTVIHACSDFLIKPVDLGGSLGMGTGPYTVEFWAYTSPNQETTDAVFSIGGTEVRGGECGNRHRWAPCLSFTALVSSI